MCLFTKEKYANLCLFTKKYKQDANLYWFTKKYKQVRQSVLIYKKIQANTPIFIDLQKKNTSKYANLCWITKKLQANTPILLISKQHASVIEVRIQKAVEYR